MFENYTWFDLLGNIGVALILIAYFLLQKEKLSNKDFSYNLMNALGAFLILLSLIFDFNLSAFIIESIWLLLSLPPLIRYFRNKNSH